MCSGSGEEIARCGIDESVEQVLYKILYNLAVRPSSNLKSVKDNKVRF